MVAEEAFVFKGITLMLVGLPWLSKKLITSISVVACAGIGFGLSCSYLWISI